MQADVLQSTSTAILLKVYLSDHTTPATGKTVAITISKNLAAFGNPSAGATNATEIASGWYSVTLSTTDTGTLGPLIVLGTCSGCDNADQAYTVVAVASALTLATAVPTTGNVANSLGDCLNAARAQGFGKWVINGTTLSLYADDGTTVVRSFTLDSSTPPITSRT